ncbi:MAG: alanine/ornithine racemase family PLP-dependent enzyme [Flavobacteriaceae bacterium]|nr:alanine/ornithine racemase family PLP-dependent enzyme [Flavobacteriaceae bacterium]
MITPRIEINLDKIAHNTRLLKSLYSSKGISIMCSTKVVCGDTKIAKVLLENGIETLADSRISNIIKIYNSKINVQLALLRTPLVSQAELVVKYVDISLNSEISVIKELSKYAQKYNITHKIILMVELGDLREGIMPSDLEDTIEKAIAMQGIKIVGIGTNLTCFNGIEPDDEKMKQLSLIVKNIREKFNLTLEIISGGNSANYNWFMSTKDVGEINNLRIGESVFMGCETLYGKPIPNLFTDVFTLITEVIESKIKPSVPYGAIHKDVSINIPKFHNQESMRRAILGIGLQDTRISGLTPMLDIEIIGATSDHLIIDCKNQNLQVGNEIKFNLNYEALLSAMTSSYVAKVYV